jgi:hypothetical protein
MGLSAMRASAALAVIASLSPVVPALADPGPGEPDMVAPVVAAAPAPVADSRVASSPPSTSTLRVSR